MDINYELYKVFYHVATSLSFSEAQQAALHFPVCSKPVHQDLRKEIRAAAFYPEHQESPAYSGRTGSVKTH